MTVKELFIKAGYTFPEAPLALKASGPQNVMVFARRTVHLWDPLFNRCGWDTAPLDYHHVLGWECHPNILSHEAEPYYHLLPPEVLEKAGVAVPAGGQ
jgi:hypothetical protein